MPSKPNAVRVARTALALLTLLPAIGCSDDGVTPPVATPAELVVTIAGSPASLWLVREDGSELRRLADGFAEPVWRPDGQRLLVSRFEGSALRLMSIAPDGTGATFVADASTAGAEPAWSPDGQRIAFVTGPLGSRRIVVANADGSAAQPIPASGEQRGPTWSPDGRRLAFFGSATTPNGPGFALFVLDVDGGAPSAVGTVFNGRDAAWSPDGTRIAYAFGNDVHTIRPDGTDGKRLVLGTERAWDLAWSPDGRRLAYTAGERTQGTSQLFVVDAVAGATPTAVLPRSTFASGPSWRP